MSYIYNCNSRIPIDPGGFLYRVAAFLKQLSEAYIHLIRLPMTSVPAQRAPCRQPSVSPSKSPPALTAMLMDTG